jgi:hypothetical protein
MPFKSARRRMFVELESSGLTFSHLGLLLSVLTVI